MTSNISRFFVFAFIFLVSGFSYAKEIHCPRANTITPATADEDYPSVYGSNDGGILWWGLLKGKRIKNISFDKVEFSSSSGTRFYFRNCYYHADGKVLEISPFDGDNVSAWFKIPSQSTNFIKNNNKAYCAESELGCIFNYDV